MKNFILLMSIVLNSYAFAGDISIKLKDICTDDILVEDRIEINSSKSVADLTINFLDKFSVPYIGAKQGINSILSTPTGLDAMEVISDTKLRAYGWCFSVNGKISELMMDQTFVSGSDEITWFFGYTFYDSGIWGENCKMASKVPTCSTLF